jgi:hypothetical protein
MKPLRNRLQESRKRLGIPWEILEKDYVLSWLLAGVSEVEALRDTLVFKGGTALCAEVNGTHFRYPAYITSRPEPRMLARDHNLLGVDEFYTF